MAANVRRIPSSAILLIAISVIGQGAYADATGSRLLPWRVDRDRLRFEAVATDNVMKLLAITPGMTILDIGAGTGQFAHEFARRLNGTGNVYATDTNALCVDYMEREAAGRGLGNLHPVLVRRDGVDTFYRTHRFDLITVFHLVTTYEERIGYFRELKDCLAKDGRLVLILYKIPTPFSAGDFQGNLRDLIRALLKEPAESPFHRILKDSTREMLRACAEAGPSGAMTKAIVDDFNAALPDPRFTAQFHAGSVFRKQLSFLPEERRHAEWLLAPFQDNMVRMKRVKARSGQENRMFETINKLLIVQKYREFLKKDGLFASGFTPSIRTAFEKAGYSLVDAYPDVIPFEDLVVFSPK